MEDNAIIAAYRRQFYNIAPAAGQAFDAALLSAQGFGAMDANAFFTNLGASLKTASDTLQLSLKQYLDARTTANTMAQAYASGSLVDAYTQGAGAGGNVVGLVDSAVPRIANATIKLIQPYLLWGGAIALVAIMMKRSR